MFLKHEGDGKSLLQGTDLLYRAGEKMESNGTLGYSKIIKYCGRETFRVLVLAGEERACVHGC